MREAANQADANRQVQQVQRVAYVPDPVRRRMVERGEGNQHSGISVTTGMLIAFSTFHHPAADRVGDVSYSLYLLHLPIGVSLIGCLSHWLPYSGSYIILLDVVGLAASGLVAWIMYQAIEKPSQEMSSAIRFTRRQPERASRAAIAATAVD